MKRRLSSVTALLLVFSILLAIPMVLELVLQTIRTAHEVRDEWEQTVRSRVNQFDVNHASDTATNWDDYRLQFLTSVTDYGDTPMEAAAVFFENGVPVTTRSSCVYMDYYTEDLWYSKGLEVTALADDKTPFMTLHHDPDYVIHMESEFRSLSFNWEEVLGADHPLIQQIMEHGGLVEDVIRMTGYAYNPDGGLWLEDFIPTYVSILRLTDPSRYLGKSLGEWDAEGELQWDTIYHITPNQSFEELVEQRMGTESEPVTIYLLGGLAYRPGGAFENSNIQMDPELEKWLLYQMHSPYNTLWVSEIINSKSGVDDEGNYHELWAALRCYPMKQAIGQLVPVYLLVLLLFVGQLLVLRLLLERWLEKPLQQIAESSRDNFATIRNPYWARFSDVIQVQQGYMNAQKELQTLRQENTRLQTALEYAENAEINRRQMVSNITHELKTPLAVIHSYCEGLQAGIAPEKQQKYLDVITEEADRMDAMVLEMLDLSRLEAGKVRLAQDSVELLGLTRSILDRLQPLLEAKELTLEYPLSFPAQLTADEARMTQVITNLASNAIKYSPQGGRIIICISQRHGYTHFSIENESPPLSQEALEKIWESFYRTEQSRTTKGTGLGLPICKAIIELHGGTCRAQNTSTGVEFSFSIP